MKTTFPKQGPSITNYRSYKNFDQTTILVKILGTSHKIALLQFLIQCPLLPPFQRWSNQTPFDHPNIELGGKGDEEVLNVCFHLDILGNMTKTQKFASVPIYFDQDCSFKQDLRTELGNVDASNTNYGAFETAFDKVLNKHAPLKKKYVRANNAPFMTKALVGRLSCYVPDCVTNITKTE